MGPSITVFVEARSCVAAGWDGLGEVRVLPDYDLFAKLAGVHNVRGLVPFALPRGLPVDVSPEVLAEAEDVEGDFHSASWLTLKELEEGGWAHAGAPVCAEFVAGVLPYAAYLAQGAPPEDVRLVFWFNG